MAKLTAYEFGKLSGNRVKHRFGLDPVEAAAALRRLAERVEKGEAIAREARVFSRATVNEFTETTLVFRLLEPEETPR